MLWVLPVGKEIGNDCFVNFITSRLGAPFPKNLRQATFKTDNASFAILSWFLLSPCPTLYCGASLPLLYPLSATLGRSLTGLESQIKEKFKADLSALNFFVIDNRLEFHNFKLHRKNKNDTEPKRIGSSVTLAERAGFEPAVRFRTPAFQASTFDHSDISPYFQPLYYIKFCFKNQCFLSLSIIFFSSINIKKYTYIICRCILLLAILFVKLRIECIEVFAI